VAALSLSLYLSLSLIFHSYFFFPFLQSKPTYQAKAPPTFVPDRLAFCPDPPSIQSQPRSANSYLQQAENCTSTSPSASALFGSQPHENTPSLSYPIKQPSIEHLRKKSSSKPISISVSNSRHIYIYKHIPKT